MHPAFNTTFTSTDNPTFSPTEITLLRQQTPGCTNVIHLNNAGAGLMPEPVLQVQLDHLNLEASIGGYEAAAQKADAIQQFYHQAALLFNSKPTNIAFTSSATDSFTRALSSIPFQPGDIILTDKDDFVSNQIQFLSLQKHFKIQIVHINNAPEGGVDLDDLDQKLKTHQPRLLAITHIPTNSGLVQPVHEIASIYNNYRQTHPDKIWYILDACQSAGQMPLDVQQLKCDFLSVTGRKFLRGPRGTGILYISDRALTHGLEPLFIDMRGAEWITADSYRQQTNAKRFEDWEFAYSTVLGTAKAIEYCRNIGEEKISKQVTYLANTMRQELATIDKVRVLDKGPQLGGLVTFHVKDGDPVHIVQQLLKRKINTVPSYRAFGLLDFDEKGVTWAVRASPHYYNTIDEINTFIEAVKEITR